MRPIFLPALAAALFASTAVIAQEDPPKSETLEKAPSVSSEIDAASPPPASDDKAADAIEQPSADSAPADKSADAAPAAADSSDKTADSSAVLLSDDQAKEWINKVVYSSDEKNLGEVAAFARDASGSVTEMHADIGGFLGVGETRVRISPKDFTLAGDHVVLSLTAEQAKALPKIPKS